MIVFDRVKEVVCFGEGAGANILTRFAVSIISNTITTQYTRHEHKHASAFTIGQLRHNSATALSHATHAVDAIAAHRFHELWSHTHVAEWQTIAPDMWPRNSPDLNLLDYAIWSVIQLDAALFEYFQRVHYKSMKIVMFSFSLGSVSTLIRWGWNFCHVYVKHFFPFTTVQKL